MEFKDMEPRNKHVMSLLYRIPSLSLILNNPYGNHDTINTYIKQSESGVK